MPVYEILLSKAVRKQLASLPVFIHNKIIEDISALTTSPRPSGCKKLEGFKNSYRIRVGDYRIIYEVEDKILRIIIRVLLKMKKMF